jgi:hypothetical protein
MKSEGKPGGMTEAEAIEKHREDKARKEARKHLHKTESASIVQSFLNRGEAFVCKNDIPWLNQIYKATLYRNFRVRRPTAKGS